jgi:hypothetical protein
MSRSPDLDLVIFMRHERALSVSNLPIDVRVVCGSIPCLCGRCLDRTRLAGQKGTMRAIHQFRTVNHPIQLLLLNQLAIMTGFPC